MKPFGFVTNARQMYNAPDNLLCTVGSHAITRSYAMKTPL